MKRRFFITIPLLLGNFFLFGQCTEDCVWPGDANANGIANHMDLLAMGLAWENTGPPRVNQTTNWEAHEAEDWGQTLPISGADFKHCDADGNGEVLFSDIEAITNNFEETNDNFTGLLGNNFIGEDLKAIPSQNTVTPGAVIEIDLQLGSMANPIEGIYGIGFSLNLNSDYVADVTMNFDNSWLGNELIAFLKHPPAVGQAHIALSRFDGMPMSGFGSIATLEIVIVDIIDALEVDSTECLTLDLSFENVLAINEFEEDLLITSSPDSIIIKHPSQLNSITEKANAPVFNIFPNPADDHITIRTKNFKPHSIHLKTSTGQLHFQQEVAALNAEESSLTISVADLPAGVYWLEVRGKEGSLFEKVIIY